MRKKKRETISETALRFATDYCGPECEGATDIGRIRFTVAQAIRGERRATLAILKKHVEHWETEKYVQACLAYMLTLASRRGKPCPACDPKSVPFLQPGWKPPRRRRATKSRLVERP